MEEETGEEINPEEEDYFFDTYAIIEIVKENKSYTRYVSKKATTTIFNLAEIYFVALRDLSEDKANTIYNEYKKAVVNLDDETLKEAVKFKKLMNNRQISYTDSIGYIYAKRHNMKFLTGDKEFENLENVEFVK